MALCLCKQVIDVFLSTKEAETPVDSSGIGKTGEACEADEAGKDCMT